VINHHKLSLIILNNINWIDAMLCFSISDSLCSTS